MCNSGTMRGGGGGVATIPKVGKTVKEKDTKLVWYTFSQKNYGRIALTSSIFLKFAPLLTVGSFEYIL